MTEKEFLTKCLAEYDEFYTDSILTRSEFRSEFLNEFLEQHHKEYYEVEFVKIEEEQECMVGGHPPGCQSDSMILSYFKKAFPKQEDYDYMVKCFEMRRRQ